MANDAEERAVVMASMNAIDQAIAAGTQVVQWPATNAPNFQTGFRSALGTTVAQLFMVFIILLFSSRELRQGPRHGREETLEVRPRSIAMLMYSRS
jgi:ACS family pantothenate transporter-like MFS transporter